MSTAIFYPSYSIISSITQGLTTIVTFSADHDFTDGEIVSFRVSPPFGMVELNNKQGKVLSSTDDTITVDIDSSTWTAFTDAGAFTNFRAMCVPVGSGIIPNSKPISINIEDAFDVRRG